MNSREGCIYKGKAGGGRLGTSLYPDHGGSKLNLYCQNSCIKFYRAVHQKNKKVN